MATKWEDALCYSTPTFITHKVNGVDHRFYPCSVGMVFKLRNAAKNVVKAIADMFADQKRDYKTIDSTREGERTVVLEPITIELTKYRDEQKAAAWSNALDSITNEETVELLAEMIMDSMREVFVDGQRPSPKEFVQKTKAPTFAQMLVGLAKGNVDVLGPLGKTVSSALSQLEEALSTKLTGQLAAVVPTKDSTPG